jgi:hypothetical protein
MKLFLLMYGGPTPERVGAILERHDIHEYTTFAGGKGVGRTGKREGSRAWPGETTMVISIVPRERVDATVAALEQEADALPPGERLHVAVLETQRFF